MHDSLSSLTDAVIQQQVTKECLHRSGFPVPMTNSASLQIHTVWVRKKTLLGKDTGFGFVSYGYTPRLPNFKR